MYKKKYTKYKAKYLALSRQSGGAKKTGDDGEDLQTRIKNIISAYTIHNQIIRYENQLFLNMSHLYDSYATRKILSKEIAQFINEDDKQYIMRTNVLIQNKSISDADLDKRKRIILLAMKKQYNVYLQKSLAQLINNEFDAGINNGVYDVFIKHNILNLTSDMQRNIRENWIFYSDVDKYRIMTMTVLQKTVNLDTIKYLILAGAIHRFNTNRTDYIELQKNFFRKNASYISQDNRVILRQMFGNTTSLLNLDGNSRKWLDTLLRYLINMEIMLLRHRIITVQQSTDQQSTPSPSTNPLPINNFDKKEYELTDDDEDDEDDEDGKLTDDDEDDEDDKLTDDDVEQIQDHYIMQAHGGQDTYNGTKSNRFQLPKNLEVLFYSKHGQCTYIINSIERKKLISKNPFKVHSNYWNSNREGVSGDTLWKPPHPQTGRPDYFLQCDNGEAVDCGTGHRKNLTTGVKAGGQNDSGVWQANGTDVPTTILNFDQEKKWILPQNFKLSNVVNKMAIEGCFNKKTASGKLRKIFLHVLICRGGGNIDDSND